MIKNGSSFNVMYITNVDKTEQFYKSLGANIIKVEPDKVVVKLESFDLHFILETTEPFLEYHYATKQIGRGMGNLMYMEVENLDEFYTQCKSLGTKTTSIFTNMWGGKEFLVEDPDGYKLVFYQML